MKSTVYLLGLLCVMMMFGGCKTKESAYKQAYDTAQSRSTVSSQTSGYQTTTPSNNPGWMTDRSQTTSYDDPFQSERLTVMDGRNLRQYSVVIGSFQNRTNAESLKNRMQAQGYSPVVARSENGMWYRVIVASFNTRAEAEAQRDAIKSRYSQFHDAWLLNRQY